MTKEQFLTKIDEMSDTTASDMREKARKLLKTGAIDLDAWENDYRFPKIVMCALSKEAAYQWQPLTRPDRKEVSNIEHFI